jgi:hypothetical protein
VKREDKNTDAKKILTVEEPENLPADGSGAEERLRSAEHEEGKAPARQGEERVR